MFLFALLLNVWVFAAPAAAPQAAVSDTIGPEAVPVPNSSAVSPAEPVVIPNSRTAGVRESVVVVSPSGTVIDEGQDHATKQAAPVNGRVRRKGRIITGAALFGVSYGIALAVSGVASSEGSSSSSVGYLSIPVVGPMILYFAEPTTTSSETLPVTLLCAGWSVAQGMGLWLLISGIVGHRAEPHVYIPPVTVEPLVLKDRAGLTVRVRL